MLGSPLGGHVFAGAEGAFYDDVVEVIVGSFGGCGEAALGRGEIGRGFWHIGFDDHVLVCM